MKLQLLMPYILNINGPITGKLYIFNGAGSIVNVDTKDGDIMKDKMTGPSCCAGTPPQHIFQVVATTYTRSR